MNELESRLTRKTIVVNPLGLHARPAAMIAERALKAKSTIWLIKNDQQTDASSIIDILSLECLKDSEVTVRVEDTEDLEILDDIIRLFENGFGE